MAVFVDPAPSPNGGSTLPFFLFLGDEEEDLRAVQQVPE